MHKFQIKTRALQAALLSGALLLAAGCKREQAAVQPPPRTDQQVTNDIQAKIAAESALNGQNIQVTVANGVATLSGAANDDASRALAGNERCWERGCTSSGRPGNAPSET